MGYVRFVIQLQTHHICNICIIYIKYVYIFSFVIYLSSFFFQLMEFSLSPITLDLASEDP